MRENINLDLNKNGKRTTKGSAQREEKPINGLQCGHCSPPLSFSLSVLLSFLLSFYLLLLLFFLLTTSPSFFLSAINAWNNNSKESPRDCNLRLEIKSENQMYLRIFVSKSNPKIKCICAT
uniref:Uncharacterized protein n=1 Tax=Rhizophora mucronata TaxID=61149 RepID=A0A2P2NL52_RHIMU